MSHSFPADHPRNPEFVLDASLTRRDPNLSPCLRACEAAGRRAGGMMDTTADNIGERLLLCAFASMQGVVSGAARKCPPAYMNGETLLNLSYNFTRELLRMLPNSGDPESDLVAHQMLATGIARALDEFVAQLNSDQLDTFLTGLNEDAPTTPPN